MPTEDEVAESKRQAQKALFDRIGAAAENTNLSFGNLEVLARAYRYAAGGAQPSVQSTTK